MEIRSPKITDAAAPGQFVMVSAGHETTDPLLRRPLSIHQADNDALTLLYRVVGKGTRLMSFMKKGEEVSLLGPLGNGFEIKSAPHHCLVGGGLGVAPLLFLAAEIKRRFPSEKLSILLGGRSHQELLLVDDFQHVAPVFLATDDGSQGMHGLVTDLLVQEIKGPATIYTCGPTPMMKGVAALAREHNWPCQVSLETMMACGMGACLGCTVERAGFDDTDSKYVHVCKDGPVFEAGGNMAVDTGVNIGEWRLANPIMTASGTFGYGEEFSPFVDLSSLGAIVVKGISLNPRPGNPPPRVVETASGMLNAIGLQNVGVDRFISEKMEMIRKLGAEVVVNILGDSLEDYRELATRLADVEGIAAIEVNISCPNVKKGGVAFGTDPSMAAKVAEVVGRQSSRPVIIKLSPNVTDITVIARAVEEAGATAISLINTLIGMAIDIKTAKPKLANVIGGLSGPAIKPVALRMVYQVASTVKIPVIGIGGITSLEDVIEFMMAGATAVQIGTANFINPAVSGELVRGLSKYLEDTGRKTAAELIGSVQI